MVGTLRKHQWIATLLSLVFTGLGMFYIGTPGMIINAVILMALQGISLYTFFMTLGFLGAIILPFALLVHSVGIIVTLMYFRRRNFIDPNKAQRRERQLSSSWKIALRTVIGLVIFIVTVYGGYTQGMAPFSKTTAEKKVVQEAAESYLANRYNESFVVSEVKYIWAIGSYSLKAHPKQNSDLEFSLDSSNGDHPNISNDGYLNALWAHQLKDKLSPVMDEFYPDQAFIYTWVNADNNQVVEKDYNNLRGEKGISISSQLVNLTVFADLTADNLKAEKERVLELIQRMPEVMMKGETALEIDYYPAELATPVNMEKLGKGTFDQGFNEGKQTHIFRVDDISEITAASSLEIRDLTKN